MNRVAKQTKWRRGLNLIGLERHGVRRVRARRQFLGSRFELLEDRQLLAATLDITGGALSYTANNAASALTVTVEAGSGGLNESFTDADQIINLSLNALTAGWRGSGSNTVTGPISSVLSMTIGGTSAGQGLTIDYTNGDPLPGAGVTFDPATATGQAVNSLTLTSGAGGTGFNSETYVPTGAHAGTITYSDSANSNVPITFSNLTPVTDTVASPSFFFIAAPPSDTGTTVNIVDGPVVGGTQTTEINDGGTGSFELIDFANKTAVTATEQNSGATTTINVTTPAPGLTQLFADSQALGGNDTIDVQATPSGVSTTTDTGSTANGQTNVGLSGLISSINGPVIVQSTGGANTLTIDDSAEPVAATYTIASSMMTATSLPSSITLGGAGITTLNLKSSGGSTVNLPQLVESGVTTFDFTGGTGLGANTLNTTSPTPRPDYTSTAGVITFGAGDPTIDFADFEFVNITKPAIPPTGAGVNISFTPGQALTNVTVATFTLDPADLSNISTNFTATIDWGDASAPSAGTITANGGGSFNILGTHTYSAAGPFIINVTLVDQQTVGSATVAATTVTVTSNGPVNSIPNPIVSAANSSSSAGLTAQGGTVAGKEGAASLDNATANGVLLATFTDSTPGVTGDYTASIDWGDGSAAGTGIITSQGTGSGTVFSVYGNHTYPEESTYPVTVTITKTATGAVAIALGQAVISDAALTATTATALNASTGQALPAASIIGSFTDANTGAPASDFTATIDWGDGSPSTFGSVVAGTTAGTFDVEATHIYAKPLLSPATYKPTIVVHDVGGSVVTLATPNTAAITVSDAAVTGSTKSFTAVEGINTGLFVLATFTDPNVLATVANETASLAAGGWGDGTPGSATGPGSLVVQQIGVTPLTSATNPGGPIFEVLGSHTYLKEFTAGAPAPLSVVITTLGGATTTLTSPPGGGVTVADAPLTASGASISGVEGSSTGSVVIATFTDANPAATLADFPANSVSVNWGDGSAIESLPASAVTMSGSPNGVQFAVTASHTYADAGHYQLIVTIKDIGGSTATVSSSAVIADAPLTPAVPQPTVTMLEQIDFTGVVGTFIDGNPSATSDFTYVSVDWGDGTPQSPGTVVATSTPGTFNVIGTHTYVDSGVYGGFGTYPVTINVNDVNGSSTMFTNTANVIDVPLTVTGQLAQLSNSSSVSLNSIRNIIDPSFFGTTSLPDVTVNLFAQPIGGGSRFLIGQSVSDNGDGWSITANQPLPDGAYVITAIATDSSGRRASPLTTIVPDLVIDTVGPKVTGVTFNPAQGRIVVTFQDYGGPNNTGTGLNASSLIDASNYQLVTAHHPRVGKYVVNVISDVPGTASGTQTVTLSINDGHSIKAGWYDLTVFAASLTHPSGVRDMAGNALDGEFYGYFPSGNNVNSGNFVAQLTKKGQTIFAPSTVVGRATPVSPPGSRQGKVTVPGTVAPSKLHHASPTTKHKAPAKQKAGRKLVHHSSTALGHLIKQVGSAAGATTGAVSSSSKSTAMGALGTLDQALDQLGAPKHKKS